MLQVSYKLTCVLENTALMMEAVKIFEKKNPWRYRL
jgi:hypothetical protein